MTDRASQDCEPGFAEFLGVFGSMLTVKDYVGVALANPKDRKITYPLDGNEDTSKYFSEIINQERIRLELCVPAEFSDNSEQERVLDNVEELCDNIETECTVHYLSSLPVQFAASEKDVLIEKGYITSDGFVEDSVNNVCNNPYEDVSELIIEEMSLSDEDLLADRTESSE